MRTKGRSLPETGYSLSRVTIYRAVPSGVTRFFPRDYVTRSRRWAEGHADHVSATTEGDAVVLKAQVNASDVYEAPNPGEFFYDGPEVAGRIVYRKKNASPSRVASRYMRAIVVPPRRDREYAMYRAFLKRLKRDWEDVKSLEPLLEKGEDALSAGGILNLSMPSWRGEDFIDAFESSLGDRRDIALDLIPPEDYFSEKMRVRNDLTWALESADRNVDFFRRWVKKLDEAVNSQDFDDEAPYTDLTSQEVQKLKSLPEIAGRIPEAIELLLKRIKRTRDPESEDIPASAEVQDLETLYHASVKAKQLASKGFSLSMPETSSSAGLGGSQSLSGGGKGISFTEDQYVAKEIARVLKEVAMVAQGDVTARQILDWAQRSGRLSKVIDWFGKNYADLDRLKERLRVDGRSVFFERYEMDEDFLAEVKAGRAEYDPKRSYKWVSAPLREVFGTPEAAMGLYLSYLMFSGRYDPKFFGVGGPKGLVRKFKSLNPKDIGYIAAKVNMTDPRITYGKGEREFRVPPEAVVSVDRFIG